MSTIYLYFSIDYQSDFNYNRHNSFQYHLLAVTWLSLGHWPSNVLTIQLCNTSVYKNLCTGNTQVLVITWPRVPYAKYWHSSDVITNLLHGNGMHFLGDGDVYGHESLFMTHFSNRESMAACALEPVVAGSILERAEKDGETLDWLSIPADQRIIDDKSLTFADVPGLFGTDDELECEEKENMKPEPKRRLASSLALILHFHISNWRTVF